jgi:hypothetical protein
MTRYTVSVRRKTPARSQELPAIWRGIGCVLMLVVPLTSWILAAASIQLALDRGWPIPFQLLGYPVVPKALWNVRAFAPILAPIQSQQNLYAIVAVFLLYLILAGALISLLYAIAYRVVGPPTYGPIDAPPPPIKVRRYKR